MSTVITLPREITTRGAARRIVPASTSAQTDVVLDAATTRHTTAAGIDVLVRALLAADLQRVIVVNAEAHVERMLRVVHRARVKPERTFLLTFQSIPADALLRPA
jgi:L-aminopeptidase/D-esterase-like protein